MELGDNNPDELLGDIPPPPLALLEDFTLGLEFGYRKPEELLGEVPLVLVRLRGAFVVSALRRLLLFVPARC